MEIQQKELHLKKCVYRIDEIIVDCEIPLDDQKRNVVEGREFWKKYFLIPKQELQESVPWKDFIKDLAKELNIPISDFDTNLRNFIGEKDENKLDSYVVTLGRFSQLLQAYGPFFMPQGKSRFDEMKKLVSQPWFHGFIDSDVAEKRLQDREQFTFLVRQSLTNPNEPFAISKVVPDKKRPQHKRIAFNPKDEVFSIPTKKGTLTFKSLITLVACEELELKYACPKNEVGYNPYEDDE